MADTQEDHLDEDDNHSRNLGVVLDLVVPYESEVPYASGVVAGGEERVVHGDQCSNEGAVVVGTGSEVVEIRFEDGNPGCIGPGPPDGGIPIPLGMLFGNGRARMFDWLEKN